jgi:crotonobetaine/carnitine-CoA ligase
MSRRFDTLATLPQMLEIIAEETPGFIALIDAATERPVTARQFVDSNRAWARAFAAAGVIEGATVATLIGASFDAYYAWLGLSLIGAVEVPVSPQLKGRTLTYLVNHSQARMIVTQRAFVDEIAAVADTFTGVQTVVVLDAETVDDIELPFKVISGPAFLAVSAHPAGTPYRVAERHDTACIIYTSGTTGPPKGVVIPWGWLDVVDHLPERVANAGGTRYSFLSPAHMSGKGALGQATVEGRTLVLRPDFSVRAFWHDIRKYDCRVSQLFPRMVKYLLAQAAAPDDRAVPLRHFWMAPLIPEVREFMDRFDVAVSTGYGMTETGGPISGPGIDGTNLRTCGQVSTDPRGYEVRIVDEFDRELGPGKVGELIVRTSVPWTMNSGYYRNPEATAQAWRNGWFHTGDALMKDADGNFYFVDRYKDCIRRKGENISSFEVEAYALDYPGVAEAAAIGVASEDGEQEVKIFLVAGEHQSLDLDAVGTWLGERMPRFMIPRYLEILPEFPKTPATGRIQKGVLRSRAPGALVWDRQSAAPPRDSGDPRVVAMMAPVGARGPIPTSFPH